MDPERTFLRVHARATGMLSQLLTPRIRLTMEYVYLAIAVALFCLLVVMHTNFVQQPGCSEELAGIEFTEAQLVHIKIISAGLWTQDLDDKEVAGVHKQGSTTENCKLPDANGEKMTTLTSRLWSYWISSGERSKLIFKPWKNDKEVIEPPTENVVDSSIMKVVPNEAEDQVQKGLHPSILISPKESSWAAIISFIHNWWIYLSSFWKDAEQFTINNSQLWNAAGWNVFHDISKRFKMLCVEHLDSLIVHWQWLDKRSKPFEATYLYTVEKGFFMLPESARSRHNIRTANITISAQNSCFGNRWQRFLISSFVGYDTIIMNSLMSSPGQGYLYNFQTKEFHDLSYGHEASEGPARFGDYFVTKCGVLIMSLFVFFTTTMSVSFTLRETQARMLRFTVQLQHHARHQLPTFQLIFVHVIESLVFVPIMIGILFFLFEFYDDQLLAFLVLTLVWLCELFTMMSVRTSISMQFFPRFFLLYFLVFHIYFFSYAYGFTYLAFSATTAFMQHLLLYFWNRFEVPALQRFLRIRGQQQQHANVQITSSTIYTSTLHIARVNVRNSNMVNSELVSGPQLSRPDHARPDTGTQEQTARDNSVSSPLDFPDSNPQQTGTAPRPSLLNPFASFLLWLLGGASSDGIVSFFAMLRDVLDQGQAYEEPPVRVNELPVHHEGESPRETPHQ
ncbi:uncharacterized protein M6B38_321410 [Iris pallida]|uniref:Membralin n=1 Tax=Iris pallida TaxID=29817 RepID=A0AAX6HD71_IRIPA|nr:uncharacterized protein M6B38_135525 [Iris pallida]KAJ6838335.1 uncharacterized protein M6B38_321410 [Iris pallida]